MRLRCTVLVLVYWVGLAEPPVSAAQPDDRATQRVRAALEAESRIGSATLRWTDPAPKTFGPLTLLPPTGRGEIVRVRVPIGELVVEVAHTISAATQRRRQAAAKREVEAALAAFVAGKPAR